MTDKTHQVIGVTAAFGYVLAATDASITWPLFTVTLAGAIIGSAFPDLDQPTANLWDELPLGRLLGKITSRALGGHRNLSHSILGFTLFAFLMYWISNFLPTTWYPQIFLMASLAGFAAHLAADSVTALGIPIFWPFGANMGFPPRPLHGIRIITGKWFENLVVFPLAFVGLGFLVWLNAERFCGSLGFLCS